MKWGNNGMADRSAGAGCDRVRGSKGGALDAPIIGTDDDVYADLLAIDEDAAEQFAAKQFWADYPHECPQCHGDPNYQEDRPGNIMEREPDEWGPCDRCQGRGRVA